MNRVTPELAKQAYAQTGFIPVMGYGDPTTACPLKAIREAFGKLSFSESYINGFIAGYEILPIEIPGEMFQQGLADGMAVRQEIPPRNDFNFRA